MTEYTESGTYKYSQTVNAQVNPNSGTTYNAWTNMGNAVGETNTFAKSKFTRKVKTKATKTKKATYIYTVPYVVTAHDFRLNIPSNAYVTNVRIEACMKLDSSKATVKFPNASFMVYGGTGSKVVKEASNGKTGWHDSTWKVYAKKYLSTSEQIGTYTLNGEEWNKMAYPTNRLNHTIMGVDFHFNKPEKMTANSVGVQIKWVRIKVDYEMPDYSLTYDIETSESNPLIVSAGNKYCVNVTFRNNSKANGDNQEITLKLPFSSTVLSYYHTERATATTVSITQTDSDELLWVCGGEGESRYALKLCLETASFGLHTLNAIHNNNNYPLYVSSEAFKQNDYDNILIEHGTIQDGEPSCFKFSSKVTSSTSQITYTVKVDQNNLTDWSKVSAELKSYYQNSNNGNNLISWELEQSSQNQRVSIASYTNNTITFNVPANQEVEIKWTGCFVPLFSGDNRIKVTYNGHNYYNSYYSLSAIGKSIYCTCDDTIWLDHRILSMVDTDSYIIPIAVKETDRLMVEGRCSLTAHIWDNLAYIGCVPIQHPHYDPDHDGTNEGLSESYKNKTYKGKKGVFEEDTSLKIKLPPADWTTLQGLVRLDKPIPVNTVPTAFEGDVLNHRGWAEITGVKGIKKTNPLYYDGQVELDYLTHDINTRFSIEKGNFINEYRNTLTSAMSVIVNSGDEFSLYTYLNDEDDLVTNPNGYFLVDTDGAYVYDGEAEETLRTMVALDNSQFVSIKSDKTLPEQSEITLTWNTTKIDENKENNIERIIYLLDKDGNQVFKYNYYDYEFDTNNDYYKCMVKAERLLSDNTWEEVLNKELLLAVDIESLQLIVDSNGNVIQESTPNFDEPVEEGDDEDGEIYEFNDFIYGSTLKFILNGNILSIVDMGYNGRQISQDNIELPISNYKYDLEWVNRNTDGDTTDVISFFDFEILETDLTSDFTNYYGNMVVSSFPVADKTLLFTRKGEEGVLYYFADDGAPFTYIQEPFYMYYGGVDLKANNNISLFNLDNSYTIFYMQNGLVRIGFNRFNGDIYLAKYDIYSQEYITTTYLKGTGTDFKIGAFSDDKIEVKAGTTVYTMYRGHPYIVINHADEDLNFTTIFNNVWAEKINGEGSEISTYWQLLNNDNLLPSCIGGENLSNSCLDVSREYIEENVTSTTTTLTKNTSTIYNDEYSYWTLTGTVSNISEEVSLFNNYNGILGTYTWENILNANGYEIKDSINSLVLYLESNLTNTSNLYLNVYKNGSSSISETYSPITTNGISFEIPHSDFSIGDVLTNFVVGITGSVPLYQLNEGVAILIDGEEEQVIEATYSNSTYSPVQETVTIDGESVTRDKYVDPVHSAYFAIKFDDNQDHTVQAVFKGNKKLKVSKSSRYRVTPLQNQSQSETVNGNYLLEIVNLPKSYKYMADLEWAWRLTKGGTPVAGRTVELYLPNGTTWTHETNSDGMIYQRVPDLSDPEKLAAFRKWIGKNKVGACYFHYDDPDDYDGSKTNILTQVWQDVNITKNTPQISFAGAGTKGNQAQFKLKDPQGKNLANKPLKITVGGKSYTKMTNSNGNVWLKVNKKGYKKYVVTFIGDTYLTKLTKTFTETVR